MVVMEGWEVVMVTGTVTDSGTPSALADVPLGPSVTTECAGVVQITRTSMAGAGGHKTSSQGSVTNIFFTENIIKVPRISILVSRKHLKGFLS